MKKEIEQIESALIRLKKIDEENSVRIEPNDAILEIPELMKDIIDYLQPLLTPYETAYYWYLFTKTVVVEKRQEGIFSINALRKDVVWPSRATQASEVPQNHVSEVMGKLEKKGVIKRIGETTRVGTPYKVNLPEEIEICLERMKIMKVEKEIDSSVDKRIDFYNDKESRLRIYERDNYKCYKCGKLLTRWDATIDHIVPVSRGGTNQKDNLVTCCLMCNSKRRNKEIELEEN